MNIEESGRFTHISIHYDREVNLVLPSDEAKIDRLIVDTINHIQDAGLTVSELRIGNPGVLISRAALNTISTLTEEQAIGWISSVRRASTPS